MQVVLKDEGEKDLTPGDLSYAGAETKALPVARPAQS